MTLGLVGKPERTRQWESYIRQMQGIEKVIIARTVESVREANGCLIITDEEPTHKIEKAIRFGLHCYAVSPFPTTLAKARSLQKLSSEAGTHLLFSHWPTYAPTTRIMHEEIPTPERVITLRRDSTRETVDHTTRSQRFWVDEIGWILKMVPSPVHKIEADTLFDPALPHPGLQVRFQFHNGSTGLFLHHPFGTDASHQRWLFRKDRTLDCDVLDQYLTRILQQESGEPLTESERLDPTQTAKHSLEQFLRTLRREESFGFTIHDMTTTLDIIERVRQQL